MAKLMLPGVCKMVPFYAEYLSLPYDEELKEFRSSASVLGDKDFLARLSSKAGRLFLRPGRPAKKENNLIANP